MNLIFFPFFSFFNIIAMHILYTSVQSKIKLVEGQSYSKFRNVLIYVRDIIKIVCILNKHMHSCKNKRKKRRKKHSRFNKIILKQENILDFLIISDILMNDY